MLAKKCFFVAIFTLLSVSLVIAQDPPAVHPKTGEELVLEVFRGTPEIDGDLSDWNLRAMTPAILDVEEQLNSGQASWDNVDDLGAEFYLLWDDEYFYMAVIVTDDKLSQNKTGGSIWNADAVEVFFSTLNAVPPHDEHYQYGFDFKEQTWNWCNMDSGGQSQIDYLHAASSLTPEGYICEAAIEYGQMLSLDFSVGSTIGFHPVLDDTDNGDREIQMTWTSREAHDQSLGFGHITFSDATIGVANPLARRPDPAEGDQLEQTWGTLTWKPGPFAVTHDVYIGDNFDDVNNGTAETFAGNQVTDMLVVGFPGFPVPDGLTPGTTYYWRVDEVNDANAASPWKGDIWSFSILSNTASDPDPADGAEFVDLDATGRQGTAPNCTTSTSAPVSTELTMPSEAPRRAPRPSPRPNSNQRRSITGASMSLTPSRRTKATSGASQHPAPWAIRSRPTVRWIFRWWQLSTGQRPTTPPHMRCTSAPTPMRSAARRQPHLST